MVVVLDEAVDTGSREDALARSCEPVEDGILLGFEKGEIVAVPVLCGLDATGVFDVVHHIVHGFDCILQPLSFFGIVQSGFEGVELVLQDCNFSGCFHVCVCVCLVDDGGDEDGECD